MQRVRVQPVLREPKGETNLAHNSRWTFPKEEACLLGAGGLCYLGDRGGLEKMTEPRGDWRLSAWEGEEADGGEARRGLLKSPLWSFQRSSSFSIDRRLFTFDSFWRDSCSAACSVDSCLLHSDTTKDTRSLRYTDVQKIMSIVFNTDRSFHKQRLWNLEHLDSIKFRCVGPFFLFF